MSDFWNTKDILRYYLKGQKDFDWYPKLNVFLQEQFPRENVTLLADLLAATSIHSSLPSNVRQFFKAKRMLETGAPFTGFLPNIVTQLEYIRAGQGLSGRKIRNFSEAIQGNPDAVVVDIWICRAFNIDITRIYKGRDVSRAPTTKEYNVVEDWIQEQAFAVGVQPRQMCSAIWGGIRTEQTGRQNTTEYQNVIMAELQQMSLYG